MNRYLLDSSALWRLLRDRRLHDRWRQTAVEGDIRSCYPQRAEFLRSARNVKEYEAYRGMFDELYADAAVPKSAGSWIGRRGGAGNAPRALGRRPSDLCDRSTSRSHRAT